jgi:hypothetical protein
VNTRISLRVAAVLGALAGPLLVAAPALATYDDGENQGSSLGVGMTLLIYVGIPVGAFLLIAFFSVLPSMLRRPRYRPGRPWNFDPLWFGGADDPDKALATARPGVTARGGASAEW